MSTPSPTKNPQGWSPWSRDHMAGRFCISCSQESHVVKCAGCSDFGIETWYCFECLDNDGECVRCEERENSPPPIPEASPLSPPLLSHPPSLDPSNLAIQHLQPSIGGVDLGLSSFAHAMGGAASDGVTTWLPTLLNECVNMADTMYSDGQNEVPTRRFSEPSMQTGNSESGDRRNTAPSPITPKYKAKKRAIHRRSSSSNHHHVHNPLFDGPLPPPKPPSPPIIPPVPPPPSSPPPPRGATSKLPVPVSTRAASHPLTAILRKLAEEQNKSHKDGKAAWKEDEDLDVCAICLEPPEDPIELPCHHAYCARCVSALRSRQLSQVCPLCRVPLPSASAGDGLYDEASRLFVPVQRAVERGRCTWASLPAPLQADLDRSMALLRRASSHGHPGAKKCLGIGKRVLLHGMSVNSDFEFIEDPAQVDGSSLLAELTSPLSPSSWTSPWADSPSSSSETPSSSSSSSFSHLASFSSSSSSSQNSSFDSNVSPNMKSKSKKSRSQAKAKSNAAKALNGAEGVATEFDEATNQFVVLLKEGGRRVRVKASNIRMER